MTVTRYITIEERLPDPETAQATLTLPYDMRQKSRFRARLDNGEDVGIILDRGPVLRGGDCLRADSGLVIKIIAAPENVSSVYCDDPLLLTRASYHLGNRHIPLQINPAFLRYQQDHVLDGMLGELGLSVRHESAPFEPEAGAYHSHTDTTAAAAITHHHGPADKQRDHD